MDRYVNKLILWVKKYGSVCTAASADHPETSTKLTGADFISLNRLADKLEQYHENSPLLDLMIEDLVDWLNGVLELDPPITPLNFFNSLKNGVILCRLANCIQGYVERKSLCQSSTSMPSKPSSLMIQYDQPPSSSTDEVEAAAHNVYHFLSQTNLFKFFNWCTAHNVPKPTLFTPKDLAENSKQVVISLMDISQRFNSICEIPTPMLIQIEQIPQPHLEFISNEYRKDMEDPSELLAKLHLNIAPSWEKYKDLSYYHQHHRCSTTASQETLVKSVTEQHTTTVEKSTKRVVVVGSKIQQHSHSSQQLSHSEVAPNEIHTINDHNSDHSWTPIEFPTEQHCPPGSLASEPAEESTHSSQVQRGKVTVNNDNLDLSGKKSFEYFFNEPQQQTTATITSGCYLRENHSTESEESAADCRKHKNVTVDYTGTYTYPPKSARKLLSKHRKIQSTEEFHSASDQPSSSLSSLVGDTQLINLTSGYRSSLQNIIDNEGSSESDTNLTEQREQSSLMNILTESNSKINTEDHPFVSYQSPPQQLKKSSKSVVRSKKSHKSVAKQTFVQERTKGVTATREHQLQTLSSLSSSSNFQTSSHSKISSEKVSTSRTVKTSTVSSVQHSSKTLTTASSSSSASVSHYAQGETTMEKNLDQSPHYEPISSDQVDSNDIDQKSTSYLFANEGAKHLPFMAYNNEKCEHIFSSIPKSSYNTKDQIQQSESTHPNNNRPNDNSDLQWDATKIRRELLLCHSCALKILNSNLKYLLQEDSVSSHLEDEPNFQLDRKSKSDENVETSRSIAKSLNDIEHNELAENRDFLVENIQKQTEQNTTDVEKTTESISKIDSLESSNITKRNNSQIHSSGPISTEYDTRISYERRKKYFEDVVESLSQSLESQITTSVSTTTRSTKIKEDHYHHQHAAKIVPPTITTTTTTTTTAEDTSIEKQDNSGVIHKETTCLAEKQKSHLEDDKQQYTSKRDFSIVVSDKQDDNVHTVNVSEQKEESNISTDLASRKSESTKQMPALSVAFEDSDERVNSPQEHAREANDVDASSCESFESVHVSGKITHYESYSPGLTAGSSQISHSPIVESSTTQTAKVSLVDDDGLETERGEIFTESVRVIEVTLTPPSGTAESHEEVYYSEDSPALLEERHTITAAVSDKQGVDRYSFLPNTDKNVSHSKRILIKEDFSENISTIEQTHTPNIDKPLLTIKSDSPSISHSPVVEGSTSQLRKVSLVDDGSLLDQTSEVATKSVGVIEASFAPPSGAVELHEEVYYSEDSPAFLEEKDKITAAVWEKQGVNRDNSLPHTDRKVSYSEITLVKQDSTENISSIELNRTFNNDQAFLTIKSDSPPISHSPIVESSTSQLRKVSLVGDGGLENQIGEIPTKSVEVIEVSLNSPSGAVELHEEVYYSEDSPALLEEKDKITAAVCEKPGADEDVISSSTDKKVSYSEIILVKEDSTKNISTIKPTHTFNNDQTSLTIKSDSSSISYSPVVESSTSQLRKVSLVGDGGLDNQIGKIATKSVGVIEVSLKSPSGAVESHEEVYYSEDSPALLVEKDKITAAVYEKQGADEDVMSSSTDENGSKVEITLEKEDSNANISTIEPTNTSNNDQPLLMTTSHQVYSDINNEASADPKNTSIEIDNSEKEHKVLSCGSLAEEILATVGSEIYSFQHVGLASDQESTEYYSFGPIENTSQSYVDGCDNKCNKLGNCKLSVESDELLEPVVSGIMSLQDSSLIEEILIDEMMIMYPYGGCVDAAESSEFSPFSVDKDVNKKPLHSNDTTENDGESSHVLHRRDSKNLGISHHALRQQPNEQTSFTEEAVRTTSLQLKHQPGLERREAGENIIEKMNSSHLTDTNVKVGGDNYTIGVVTKSETSNLSSVSSFAQESEEKAHLSTNKIERASCAKNETNVTSEIAKTSKDIGGDHEREEKKIVLTTENDVSSEYAEEHIIERSTEKLKQYVEREFEKHKTTHFLVDDREYLVKLYTELLIDSIRKSGKFSKVLSSSSLKAGQTSPPTEPLDDFIMLAEGRTEELNLREGIIKKRKILEKIFDGDKQLIEKYTPVVPDLLTFDKIKKLLDEKSQEFTLEDIILSTHDETHSPKPCTSPSTSKVDDITTTSESKKVKSQRTELEEFYQYDDDVFESEDGGDSAERPADNKLTTQKHEHNFIDERRVMQKEDFHRGTAEKFYFPYQNVIVVESRDPNELNSISSSDFELDLSVEQIEVVNVEPIYDRTKPTVEANNPYDQTDFMNNEQHTRTVETHLEYSTTLSDTSFNERPVIYNSTSLLSNLSSFMEPVSVAKEDEDDNVEKRQKTATPSLQNHNFQGELVDRDAKMDKSNQIDTDNSIGTLVEGSRDLKQQANSTLYNKEYANLNDESFPSSKKEAAQGPNEKSAVVGAGSSGEKSAQQQQKIEGQVSDEECDIGKYGEFEKNLKSLIDELAEVVAVPGSVILENADFDQTDYSSLLDDVRRRMENEVKKHSGDKEFFEGLQDMLKLKPSDSAEEDEFRVMEHFLDRIIANTGPGGFVPPDSTDELSFDRSSKDQQKLSPLVTSTPIKKMESSDLSISAIEKCTRRLDFDEISPDFNIEGPASSQVENNEHCCHARDEKANEITPHSDPAIESIGSCLTTTTTATATEDTCTSTEASVAFRHSKIDEKITSIDSQTQNEDNGAVYCEIYVNGNGKDDQENNSCDVVDLESLGTYYMRESDSIRKENVTNHHKTQCLFLDDIWKKAQQDHNFHQDVSFVCITYVNRSIESCLNDEEQSMRQFNNKILVDPYFDNKNIYLNDTHMYSSRNADDNQARVTFDERLPFMMLERRSDAEAVDDEEVVETLQCKNNPDATTTAIDYIAKTRQNYDAACSSIYILSYLSYFVHCFNVNYWSIPKVVMIKYKSILDEVSYLRLSQASLNVMSGEKATSYNELVSSILSGQQRAAKDDTNSFATLHFEPNTPKSYQKPKSYRERPSNRAKYSSAKSEFSREWELREKEARKQYLQTVRAKVNSHRNTSNLDWDTGGNMSRNIHLKPPLSLDRNKKLAARPQLKYTTQNSRNRRRFNMRSRKLFDKPTLKLSFDDNRFSRPSALAKAKRSKATKERYPQKCRTRRYTNNRAPICFFETIVKYGKRSIFIRHFGKTVMVRVGGGWQPLDQFLEKQKKFRVTDELEIKLRSIIELNGSGDKTD